MDPFTIPGQVDFLHAHDIVWIPSGSQTLAGLENPLSMGVLVGKSTII